MRWPLCPRCLVELSRNDAVEGGLTAHKLDISNWLVVALQRAIDWTRRSLLRRCWGRLWDIFFRRRLLWRRALAPRDATAAISKHCPRRS